MRINKLLILTAAGFIAACSAAPHSEKVLNATDVPLYSINVAGRLGNDIPFYHQPAGSENVYILNPETGGMFLLDAVRGKLADFCVLPPITPDVTLKGFTVSGKSRLIRLHYVDSTVMFDFRGRRRWKIDYPGLSPSGYIYPTDRDYLPLFKNGALYCSYFPSMEDGSRNAAYCKEPVEAMVNFRTKRVVLLQQIFPQNYILNHYPLGTEPKRMEISPSVNAYTFEHNDSVFIRNIETGELDVKFFGTRRRKQFQYIPYDEIERVEAGAFKAIGLNNPVYDLPCSLPLAGYFMRSFIRFSPTAAYGFDQTTILFDRNFEYIGEIPDRDAPGHPVDTRKGILTMICKNGKLTVRKLSW